jgi:hypothetical protein
MDQQLCEVYQRAFRTLLWRVRPRRLQLGVELLKSKAQALAHQPAAGGLAVALQMVYSRTRRQVLRHLVRASEARARAAGEPAGRPDGTTGRNRRRRQKALYEQLPQVPLTHGPDFHCDAALGGLARWLRAAGYDAQWWPGIDDDELLKKVLDSSAIMLTTDRRLFERGVITMGLVPAVLVSIGLTKQEQFRWVVSRLELPLRPTRCMRCGGRLVQVEKERVRRRIPPRTYPWRDDYFLCQRCDQLYWEGTHWQNIAAQLKKVCTATGPPSG